MSWTPTDISNKNLANPESKYEKAGYKTGIARVTFDPSADSTKRAADAYGLGLTLPKNSTVTKAYYKVLTTFTSATDAATIALHVTAANDIVSAVAISNGGNPWDAGGLVICLPSGDMSDEVAVTADSEVTLTVASEDLTAGKLVLWVEWVYYGDVA